MTKYDPLPLRKSLLMPGDAMNSESQMDPSSHRGKPNYGKQNEQLFTMILFSAHNSADWLFSDPVRRHASMGSLTLL
jgi:hypothetical protein